ncbi:replicative DNA helicase [Variovorax boronicumulans]|uniref:replicative DNA helicase n=1 Tax=Variovorax boronicumulans TaxID=436515 RepID=UPI00277D8A92|nr:replicative DNA helicase [Variovorax boronicumulans]MDQ0082910.1 replicative DNA helicase [Variovorax boronicumulans]
MNDRVDENLLSDVAQLRIPPHSLEAEQSVLGSLLMDNYGWDRVGDLLVDGDFYRHEHKVVFAAISSLINASKPADVITVFAELEKHGKAMEVGGLAYLHSLAQCVLSAGSIRRYAEIVRERAVLRKLIGAADEISASAFSMQGKSVDAVIDAAMQRVMAISPDTATDEWQGMEEGMVRLLDRITAQAEGTAVDDFTATGLDEIDARLDGGPRDGELIVIGARPSMGKSALALSMGLHMAMESGKAVGMFSMEMPKAQVVSRAMSLQSRIHLSRIKRGERLKDYDWPAITAAVDRLRQVNFQVNDRSGLNINQLRASARGLRRKHGKLACLIVDYLGLMAGIDPKMPRVYQIEEITKGLKSLAKELGCPIFLLCQLNRAVEQRVDQMPVLSDLRDSGSVEQDADIVMFVHRPYKANPTLSDEWKYYAKVSIAKLRDGEPGIVDVMYVGENTRFANWPAETPIPTNQVRVARSSKGAEL